MYGSGPLYTPTYYLHSTGLNFRRYLRFSPLDKQIESDVHISKAKPFRLCVEGPMLWLKKYFRKKLVKILAFRLKNKAKLCKNLILTLVFEKNVIFFAENCRNSQKIAIMTSTPEWANVTILKTFTPKIIDHFD
jgi:hypothetical protein